MTNYRADFPIFSTHPKLVYLDSAATTQKPERVIEAVSEFYRTSNANVHRGLYELSEQATESYEAVRQRVMEFIGANSVREVIFTNGATEAINLLASSLTATLQAGDEIILSKLEHHANLVPWQEAAKLHGLVLKFAEITEKGEISLTHFTSLLSPHTKLVAISHCSNVFGRINPIATIKKIITEEGSEALLLIDAAQTIPHLSLSVQDLGADFIVFSGHKLYAPSGTGVLWGREALLATLPPYQTGGDMIKTVSETTSTWNDLPWKFEAGTPNIEGVMCRYFLPQAYDRHGECAKPYG
jgi:cysteine desulfurase/selenocysteine lyase